MYYTDRIYSITDIEFKHHSIFFLCFVLFSLFLCFYCGTCLLVRPQILAQINTCFLSAVRNTSFSTDAFLQFFHGVRSFYAVNTNLMLHFLLSYFICSFYGNSIVYQRWKFQILGDVKENTHPFALLSAITVMFYFSVQVVFIPKNPDTCLNNLFRALGLEFTTHCKLDVSNEFKIVRTQHNLFVFQVTIILLNKPNSLQHCNNWFIRTHKHVKLKYQILFKQIKSNENP